MTAKIATFFLTTLVALSICATPPARAQPAEPKLDAEFTTSASRSTTMPAIDVIYTEVETSLNDFGKKALPLIEKLIADAREGRIKPEGHLILLMDGATENPNVAFKVRIALPVLPENAKPPEGYKHQRLEPHKCVSILYMGSMANVASAYQKVYTDLIAGGQQPTGHSREYHMHWEGEASPNNIVLITVEVE